MSELTDEQMRTFARAFAAYDRENPNGENEPALYLRLMESDLGVVEKALFSTGMKLSLFFVSKYLQSTRPERN